MDYQRTKQEKRVDDIKTGWKVWRRRRHVVTFLVFLGFFNNYLLRTNFSLAIVAMVDNKTVIGDNGTVTYHQEFAWDLHTQGWLLSSFFFGYISTQILGGWMAAIYGGNIVYLYGIGVTSVLTFLTPYVAHNVYFLVTVRVLEGIFEGVTYPCVHDIWYRWAPPLERSTLSAIGYSGSYIGTVISLPLCGIIAENYGWQSIFYVCGLVSMIWCVVFLIVVRKSPAEDPFISKQELTYIITMTKKEMEERVKLTYPWRKILTSMPIWANVVAHACENWGFYTLLTKLPTFMKDEFDFDLESNGLVSGIPYLAQAILLPLFGQCADRLLQGNYVTKTQIRKAFNCTGFIAQTFFMILAAYLQSPLGVIASITMSVGLGSLAWSGFPVNYLDIAPQHASVLMGFGNTFGTLPGMISPVLTSYIVTNDPHTQWKYVFFLISGIYLIGCVFYAVFASGDRLPWTLDLKVDHEMEEKYQNRAFEGEKNL